MGEKMKNVNNEKNKLMKKAKNKGITLIALVVTIVVLIILVGVSINMILGENGIITKAKQARKETEIAQVVTNVGLDITAKEMEKIEQNGVLTQSDIETILNKYGTVNKNQDGTINSLTPTGKDYEIPYEELFNGEITLSYDTKKKVNAPQLLEGMTPIKFNMPTDTEMGSVITTKPTDDEWYDYGTEYDEKTDKTTKKWANAQTKDGSMWVWIPRYAYKITYNNASDKSQGGTIDIKFLINDTDNYYDETGTIKTAIRQKTVDQTIDASKDYTVHPAFTNESNIGYANGGWDKELTGIWVAKFEAGYAQGNNTAPVVASNVKYSQKTAWVQATESTTGKDATLEVRNWLDGIYIIKNIDGTYSWKDNTETPIKYPTFQGTTYAMNYININDAYNISKALIDNGNIYGLNKANADSHLMKNSEWGAIAYLSHSKYGTNGQEITTNNINLNSGGRVRTETAGKTGVDSVYAVTGCTSNTTNTANNIVKIENLKNSKGNTGVVGSNGIAYKWNQKTGQNASTTGTIYGIYDISGGTWERNAGFVSNGHINLLTDGKALIDETKVKYTSTVTANTGSSTKYVTIYPNNEAGQTNIDTASQKNFVSNTKIYGDAIRETTGAKAGTAETGWNASSWNSDYSYFVGLSGLFFPRGGNFFVFSSAGAFAFSRTGGNAHYSNGFRAVLLAH